MGQCSTSIRSDNPETSSQDPAAAAAAAMAEEFDPNKANEAMDAMSRTIAALGVETVRNLVSLRILVVGQRGVGVETAKNIVLGRVAAVTVHDPELVEIADLGTNFYLRPEHVGKVSRAEASAPSLADLNPYVQVQAHAGELTPEFLRSFGAVIVTADLPRQELVRLNEVCRSRQPRPTAFILAQTHGVTGTFFTDFGDEHTVTDADGVPAKSLVVQHMDSLSGRVTLTQKHGLDDGARVSFAEVEGPDALNQVESVAIRRIYTKVSPKRTVQNFTTFQVDLESLNEGLRAKGLPEYASLSDLPEWRNGGIVTEVKPRRVMRFRALGESLRNPLVAEQDRQMGAVFHPDQERWMPEMYGGKGTGSQLHFAYLALLEFRARRGRLPALHDSGDADEAAAIAAELLEAHKAAPEGEALVVDKVDATLVRSVALFARAELPGYCAFLGGVAAQEIVKIFGKYTPHHQWMQSDHLELLAEPGAVPADAAPQGTRYDHLVTILGAAAQDKIANQKLFLVGCGALGCEYFKFLALAGVGTGPRGEVHVTDLDRIELSNLSRQFLFRSKHIGRPKSVCGSEAAKEMNPDMKVRTHETRVGPETESHFDDSFWDSLDVVLNALDNVHARRYVDRKCLLHTKPLLESGTMSTSANSEVIIPHKTSSYSDHKDQDVEGIAACTLRNFPNLIEHCVEWARPLFEDTFSLGPSNVNKLLENRDAFLRQVSREGGTSAQVETLRSVRALVEADRADFGACVRLAWQKFHALFRDKILDLVHYFPEDTMVVVEGVEVGKFWTGAKRFPTAASFDADNASHLGFLVACANLYAHTLGVPGGDEAAVRAAAAELEAPEWKAPSKGPDMGGEDVATNKDAGDEDDSKQEDADEAELEELLAWARGLDTAGAKPLVVSEFEKDDDTNHHIDFIFRASNLRANNYKIKECDRLFAKVLAGKIIAALATTTAAITGVIGLEILKVILGYPAEKCYNSNPNLATGTYSFFAVSEPPRVTACEVDGERVVAVPDGFTTWDHTEVRGTAQTTVREFCEELLPKAANVTGVRLLHAANTGDSGELLYSNAGKRSAPMAVQMLKRDNLSEQMRARFQAQLDAVEKHNSELEARLETPLVELYKKTYTDVELPEGRAYLLLDGDFDLDGESARIPLVLFRFDP